MKITSNLGLRNFCILVTFKFQGKVTKVNIGLNSILIIQLNNRFIHIKNIKKYLV